MASIFKIWIVNMGRRKGRRRGKRDTIKKGEEGGKGKDRRRKGVGEKGCPSPFQEFIL